MWSRLLNTALGIWLMAAPSALDYVGTVAETNDRIVGPLIATMAICAIWGIARPLRWVNVLAGIWLLMAPFVLGYGESAWIVNDMVVGVGAIAFGMIRGEINSRFGHGWLTLWPPTRSNGDDYQRELYE